MPVTLSPIPASDQNTVTRMFQLYLHDMSEFAGWPIGRDGLFSYPDHLLLPYWKDAGHHPYFIRSNGEIAGFCLVRRIDGGAWDMGQFFVLRKFRGQRIGASAFRRATQLHPGDWEVRVLPSNTAACGFWSKCIDTVCAGPVIQEPHLYHDIPMTRFRFRAGS